LTDLNVIIVGSGPAGLTAALYTARANLNPLLFTGSEVGGQVAITNEVENYPGFPDGTTGPELVQLMQKQAERFGARIEMDTVTGVDFTRGSPFHLKTHGGEYQAKAVIICTGATPRRLGVPGEDEMIGRGVSFCATCDGFFFRGKDVVVVGGGDSALEESLFLTRFVNSVRVIHRRDQLRAGDILQRRARENEKISFVWDTVVEEIAGEDAVQAVKVRNVKTGQRSELTTAGVFIYIGHIPNSGLFKDQLELDAAGYVVTDRFMRTNVPGVFAAGEIQDAHFRQVATSVGQGCAVAIECEKWLAELEDRAYPGRSKTNA
jgi:thioredoxin reductase (NADPH)